MYASLTLWSASLWTVRLNLDSPPDFGQFASLCSPPFIFCFLASDQSLVVYYKYYGVDALEMA